MRALNRKLLRDLKHLSGPAIAAALVVAAGVAAWVSLRGVYTSLEGARASYFERGRFADIVAPVVRAPLSVVAQALAIPGVEAVDARVQAPAVLDIPSISEPVRALVTSMRDDEGALNRVFFRLGRAPAWGRGDEVVVNEAFALAHKLALGDSIAATINGRRVVLTIVGIGGSPEHLYVVPPGAIWPDDARYAVLWLERDAAATLLGAEGACHDLAVRLGPGVDERPVIEALDRLLAPYGAIGAVGRDQQPGWRWVEQEIAGLKTQTNSVPLIFLGVAALILHMVLTRLVDSQREIIALLKAVGYGNATIGCHYVALALVIVAGGVTLGVAVASAFGRLLMDIYMDYFRFDVLTFEMEPSHVAAAVVMAVAAAVAGAGMAVRRVATLEPAAAMQPPAPTRYDRGVVERLGLFAGLPPAWRMILRELSRRPVRALLSVVGIALAGAIIVVASVMTDAVGFAVDLHFLQAAREDVEVSFTAAVPRAAALEELSHVPGVLRAEPTRFVPVRLHANGKRFEGALEARDSTGELRRTLDGAGVPLPAPPPDGVLLSAKLLRRLGVGLDDLLVLERIDGDRRIVQARVAGATDEMLGLHIAAVLPTAASLFGDGDLITGALLLVDPKQAASVSERLKALPRVAGAVQRVTAMASFQRMMAETLNIMRVALALLASIIAVGIVYNSARVTLAERARELATLRVLGFTRGEVSGIFLGEQLVLVVVALPLSWLIGRGFARALMDSIEGEIGDVFQLPLVTEPATYVFATVVVLGAAVFTALLSRRRIDRLDLVAVLKARE